MIEFTLIVVFPFGSAVVVVSVSLVFVHQFHEMTFFFNVESILFSCDTFV